MSAVKPGKGRFKVKGAAAVVRLLNGSEKYLYRGAAFDAAGADEASVKHLLAVGLIEKVSERAPAASSAPAGGSDAEKAAAAKAAADAAAEKAAAEKAEAEKAAAAAAAKSAK